MCTNLACEDRFVYHAELPTLQEMASHQVALAIWYSKFSPGFHEYHEYELEAFIDEAIKTLKVPRLIAEMLKTCLKNIDKEVERWIDFFDDSRYQYEMPPNDLSWCVWLANGKIDNRKTVTKILNVGGLSDVQKFMLMCKYCMKDQIETVSLHTLPADIIADIDYDDDELLFYWIFYLRKELHKLPLEDNDSIDVTMAMKVDNCLAREYFWYRISEDDQVRVAGSWIDNICNYYGGDAVVEQCISGMSWHQQSRLLSQMADKIIFVFSAYSYSSQFSLWAWRHSKDEMTAEKFAYDIDKILGLQGLGRQYICTLMEIWETAYDHQKNFVVQTMLDKAFDICCSLDDPTAIAFVFLPEFLRLLPKNDRRKILFEKATILRKRCITDLHFLNKILDKCLPCPNDQLMFKNLVADSDAMKNICVFYFEKENFEHLNQLLEFYHSHDVDTVRARRISFLQSMEFTDATSKIVFSIGRWKELEKYIDGSFPDEPSLALKEKQRIISSSVLSCKYDLCMRCRDSLNEMVTVVEMVFANEELINVKRLFSHSFGKSLMTKEYWNFEYFCDEEYFQMLTDWCLRCDEEAILEFKNRVSIDVIFDRIFYQLSNCNSLSVRLYMVCECHSTDVLLCHLDKYLKWYLTSDDQVKMYKLRRINAAFSEKLDVFKTFLRFKNDQSMEIVLKWFFDSDDVAIRKF